MRQREVLVSDDQHLGCIYLLGRFQPGSDWFEALSSIRLLLYFHICFSFFPFQTLLFHSVSSLVSSHLHLALFGSLLLAYWFSAFVCYFTSSFSLVQCASSFPWFFDFSPSLQAPSPLYLRFTRILHTSLPYPSGVTIRVVGTTYPLH